MFDRALNTSLVSGRHPNPNDYLIQKIHPVSLSLVSCTSARSVETLKQKAVYCHEIATVFFLILPRFDLYCPWIIKTRWIRRPDRWKILDPKDPRYFFFTLDPRDLKMRNKLFLTFKNLKVTRITNSNAQTNRPLDKPFILKLSLDVNFLSFVWLYLLFKS